MNHFVASLWQHVHNRGSGIGSLDASCMFFDLSRRTKKTKAIYYTRREEKTKMQRYTMIQDFKMR